MLRKSVIPLLFLIILAGCAPIPPDQRREVINHTPYTFCKVVETPNLSIYFPWQKKTRRIELPPNGRAVIRDRGRDYILHLDTCDDRYTVSNYRHWTELGEPWVLTEDMVADMEAVQKWRPTPEPTRIPAVVIIRNGTKAPICSLRISPPEWMGYDFGDNILAQPMQPGEQIELHEPEDIKWATRALGVGLCNGEEYITKAVVFEYKIIITLRGASLDNEDLQVEHIEHD